MSEADLIRRCRLGETGAFLELFQDYRDPAYRYCVGMVGNPEDARDIVQDAYLAAIRGIKRLDPGRGFAGWFYGILRHLCVATLKGRKVELAPETLRWEAEASCPEDEATQDERRRALASCLSQLTETQREVLLLREMEGLAYRDIAERLDVPMGTVMSRLYDARRALAKVASSHPALQKEARS